MKAHVIGAGMAGLSAAVEMANAGWNVSVTDSAARAGGRCRSYLDPQLDQVIDNGNHFVFSGNQAVNRFVEIIGTADKLLGPDHADFTCHDLRDASRWVLRVNDGRIPWWVLSRNRRTPGTSLGEYAALVRMVLAGKDKTIGDIVAPHGLFWDRVVEPMMLAVLNCPPAQGSAWLAGQFLKESFARGGQACRTMVATPTLDVAFVDPALAYLEARGARIAFGKRLRGMTLVGDRVAALDFGGNQVAVAEDEPVILAVPPWIASELVPGLTVPDRFCSILNAHFRIKPPKDSHKITAVIGGTAQWVLCHEDRISVTISGADDVIDEDREEMAQRIWADCCAVLDFTAPRPRWQIVKEKRATFASTPEQNARRPGTATRWRNLFLAGDWTQTNLPATIEGALRSGVAAARLAQAARTV